MKSKICIIGAFNLKHMTLISLYTTIFEKHNIPYDIIYLDKYSQKENTKANNIYVYRSNFNREWGIFRKIIEYWKFSRYAKKKIKENNYEKIILWQTFTSFLLFDLLLFRYKNKYVLNVRDYFFEKNKLVFLLQKILIKNSIFTTISSVGFKRFLPKYPLVNVHSINKSLLNSNFIRKGLNKNGKIKIGFIGNNRFFEQGIKLMNSLKNDERFELWFCGINSDILKKYAEDNHIVNCKFIDAFEPESTNDILLNFDLINNLFGNNHESVKTLTSIRLYYSAYYKIPILVNTDTYMSSILEDYPIGYVVDWSKSDLGDRLYSWYNSIDFNEFSYHCEKFIRKALEENKDFEEKVKTYLLHNDLDKKV
jgi:hypothetical protein